MTENDRPSISKPSRPLMRGAMKYDALREAAITSPPLKNTPVLEPQREEVFTITFVATKEKGVPMDNENKFLIELIFKPNEGKLRLRPQETQLLLAYYAELMKEITDEEQAIIAEEKSCSAKDKT